MTSSSEHPVPELDVDLFVDRLRFMGLDQDLVAEADHRLGADMRDGMRWLEEQLRALEPQRKPPTCDCGDPLVDVAWQGRATVRCGVCAARWGVVVGDDTESLRSISGPTAAWLAAHPIEDALYDDFAPEDVLRDGLPALPPEGIEPGTYFPVATWQVDRHAAVLYVHRKEAGEFDLPGDEYEDGTEHLLLQEDGEWRNIGSGGGGSGARTYRVDTERPFLVVGVRGPGMVRILDQHGQILHGRAGALLEFALNDETP